jgi:thiaminase
MASPNTPWSLTLHLLAISGDRFKRATQSNFLRAAAAGTLPKSTISHWLANDRLYMQGYIRLAGELLRTLQLPARPTPSREAGSIEVRLLDWLVDALVNIRREERFFMDVAERYGLDVDLSSENGVVPEEKKSEGLRRFEKLFASLTTGSNPSPILPWLEGAVVFWATEKVYFEAWSWAKKQAAVTALFNYDAEGDDDGGAMRKEFIPNWTNDEFIGFVDKLGKILDEGVREVVQGDEDMQKEVVEKAEKKWIELLEAEEAFWPTVQD